MNSYGEKDEQEPGERNNEHLNMERKTVGRTDEKTVEKHINRYRDSYVGGI